jgi:hypothetical protein
MSGKVRRLNNPNLYNCVSMQVRWSLCVSSPLLSRWRSDSTTLLRATGYQSSECKGGKGISLFFAPLFGRLSNIERRESLKKFQNNDVE